LDGCPFAPAAPSYRQTEDLAGEGGAWPWIDRHSPARPSG
jgi:hypothetical protein